MSREQGSELLSLVLDYPGKFWSYFSLIRNPNITWEDVRNNPEIFYKEIYYEFAYNINLNIRVLRENPGIFWPFNVVSCNPAMTPEVVFANLDLDWQMFHIARNRSFTLDDVLEFARLKNIEPDFRALSANPNITQTDILRYPEAKWSYLRLFENSNLSWNFIKTFPTNTYTFMHISKNPVITPAIVRANSKRRWDYQVLAENPSFTWKDIQKNVKLRKHQNCFISNNPNLTLDFIREELNKEDPVNLIMDNVWQNPGLMPEDIVNVDFFDGDYQALSFNPNLTVNFVRERIECDWNFEALSANNFGAESFYDIF